MNTFAFSPATSVMP